MPRPNSAGLPAPIVVIETGLKCQRPPDRPVDVGERFRSIAWAECSTGIGRGHICMQLNNKVSHARGVVFAYAENVA